MCEEGTGPIEIVGNENVVKSIIELPTNCVTGPIEIVGNENVVQSIIELPTNCVK
jgi:hypothetical protein